MSAIRNTRNKRNQDLLPYARPEAKKPAWSITGFLNSINPFRYIAPQQAEGEEDNDEGFEEDAINSQSPAHHLSSRGHEMSRQMNGNGASSANGSGLFSTPSKPSNLTNIYAFPTVTPETNPMDVSPPRASASPAKNFAAAKEYLAGKRGLNESEVESLRELLDNSESAEDNAPFRFSSTAPLSPERGRSPAHAPPKTLSRNPNGQYRWTGAGSARRSVSRNRYSSPAFGPSRSRSQRLILRETHSEADAMKADNKRRKVGEEADASVASASGPTSKVNGAPPRSGAPEPSPTRARQSSALPGAEPPSKPPFTKAKSPTPQTPSRLRIPPKATAPVNPSPLRQTWSGGSPGSQNDGSPTKTPPTNQKPTKAANFMTELINEVTPPRRPDLSNPYQTASPVKPTSHSKPKPKVTRRTRATGKPTLPDVAKPKEKEQEKVYTPQAIIEATLPKGSKRSRPPAGLDKSTSDKANGSARQVPSSYVVEEEDEEADLEVSPKKKSKPSPEPDAAQQPLSEVSIEVMEDVDATVSTEKPKSATSPPPVNASLSSQPSTKSVFSAFKPAFAPKEPSKLRTSYQPDSAASSPAPLPQPNLPLPANLPAVSLFGGKTASPMTVTNDMDVDPVDAALRQPVSDLPTFSFSFVTTIPVNPDFADEVKSMPATSLPTFDFSKPTPITLPRIAHPQPAQKAFNFAAAGTKLTPASGTWTCSTCMLQNPDDATEKCTICDAPGPGVASSSKTTLKSDTSLSSAPTPASTTAFNWAAAGIKPQANGMLSSDWTCSVCMLKNPADATEKCAICEAPKPGAAPKPAVQGFNWAAAGIQKPSTNGAEWTCGSCMLKNSASATEKCAICDAKR